MFTKRIIPCLDCKDGRVVKGTNFVDLRDAGDPVEVASMYDKSGADELVFLDITASSDGRNTTVDLVRRISPAPSFSAFIAHSTASICISTLPPFLYMLQ